jgi:hypothetical protein
MIHQKYTVGYGFHVEPRCGLTSWAMDSQPLDDEVLAVTVHTNNECKSETNDAVKVGVSFTFVEGGLVASAPTKYNLTPVFLKLEPDGYELPLLTSVWFNGCKFPERETFFQQLHSLTHDAALARKAAIEEEKALVRRKRIEADVARKTRQLHDSKVRVYFYFLHTVKYCCIYVANLEHGRTRIRFVAYSL